MLIERKFTPGVWEVSSKTHWSKLLVIHKQQEFPIAEVSYVEPTDSNEQAYNAKLIAAAPLMLDALEAIYTMLESEGKLNTIIGIQITDTINKATK